MMAMESVEQSGVNRASTWHYTTCKNSEKYDVTYLDDCGKSCVLIESSDDGRNWVRVMGWKSCWVDG